MTRIADIALYFPEKTFTNNDFFTAFPEEIENKTWEKLGIKKRHIIGKDEVPSDMGVKAAEKVLADKSSLKDEIDFIIFAAHERDYYTPVTASVIQAKLGLGTSTGCIDVHQGCSCFIYLLSHADGLIKIGAASKVLVVTLSSLTRRIHEKDKAGRFLFGDAATAFIVEKSDDENIYGYHFGNDGYKKEKIMIRDGEHRHPFDESSYLPFINQFGEEQIPAYFYQDGAGIFRFTLDRIPKMINDVLKNNKLKKDEVDLYLLHQPNAFVVKSLIKIAKLPEEKVIIDVENHGNTVSVSIPILIHNLKQAGKIKKGMKILIAGFGTGLSWNCCIWET